MPGGPILHRARCCEYTIDIESYSYDHCVGRRVGMPSVTTTTVRQSYFSTSRDGLVVLYIEFSRPLDLPSLGFLAPEAEPCQLTLLRVTNLRLDNVRVCVVNQSRCNLGEINQCCQPVLPLPD